MSQKEIKKRFSWNDSHEHCLIELWEELRGPRKNTHIYEEISDRINNVYDFAFNGLETKAKINHLTTKYKKEKNAIDPRNSRTATQNALSYPGTAAPSLRKLFRDL